MWGGEGKTGPYLGPRSARSSWQSRETSRTLGEGEMSHLRGQAFSNLPQVSKPDLLCQITWLSSLPAYLALQLVLGGPEENEVQLSEFRQECP